MKYLLHIFLLVLIISCDDGDLQIETIDFDAITTIQFCNTLTAETAETLFKINDNESLILQLPADFLKNETTTETLTISIPEDAQLLYRTFSSTVNDTYFCSTIPVINPVVNEEITAINGSVTVYTKLLDSNTYEHEIQLQDISFVSETGIRITDLSVQNFGTVVTSP